MIADVVVVGAGTAGCVLAGRLARDQRRRVVLVEAGPDGSTPAVDGVDFFAALAEPGRTWPDLWLRRTTAQEPVVYRRGRGLGGSSAVNALIALPGLGDDYARWPGRWGDAVTARLAAARRGETPLHLVDASPAAFVRFERALAAALEDGGTARVDPWASDGDGWFPATWTARPRPDGGLRRWSAADAYVAPARDRLTVVADAPAARVALAGGRATGVVLADGRRIDAGEVIVAAGAIHSPLLLAASGVEHPALGRGLRDHAAVALWLRLAGGPGSGGPGSGGPGSGGRPHGALLARWSSGEAPGDLQVLVLHPAGPGSEAAGTALVMVSLMQVASQGQVRPDGIDERMLSDAGDRRRLRHGVRALVALLAHPAVAATVDGAYCDDRGTPAAWLASLDDDALDAWMLRHLGDYVHAAGTCALGAVVDDGCRVSGHEGLRVCDASVLPDLPRANTHLTTWAVAEELAARLGAGA